MARGRNRGGPEINSSSMADIAFLLLIFFLVTTTIANDKGLTMVLPPKPDEQEIIDIKIKEKNLFKVLINSADRILVEGEVVTDIPSIRQMVKDHVLNYGKDPEKSDSPKDAIVSLKTDRGTSYEYFIGVLDELQGAYYDIYAERVGLTNAEWRELASDLKDPSNKEIYDRGRGVIDGEITIPMQISIAEPTKIGGN